MREEEEPTWFARWEEQLPSPEELTPLSQSLITPDLALAFDITPIPNPNPHPNPLTHNPLTHHSFDPSDPAASSAGGSSGGHNGCGPDEPARTLKRPRLVWTPQLHKRFVDAVAHLGIKNAVPKTIMQIMSVDGLTRENVASHLQKYRLYLKRMQGIGTNGNGGSSPNGAPLSASEAATEQLFASGPVPHHFLTGRSPGPVHQQPDPYMPFVPSVQAVSSVHHHQMGYSQHQFYNQRSNGLGQFNGFDQQSGIFSRSVQVPPAQHHHRMIGPGGIGMMPGGSVYMDELERNGRGGAGQRRELTLFPTGDH